MVDGYLYAMALPGRREIKLGMTTRTLALQGP
ncbi:MAG: hypothetical protein H6R06_3745 [Proteobacteria bacterium]|jgi:hypothetical protein|nr:hypothetical protein [Pseudomonadota bacterium]